MLKRLLLVMQILTLLLPIVVFITFIIADEGDQWTSAHYFATGFFSIPFIVVQILKFIIYGGDES